ncbi:hypothetical protein CBR_g3773 [Chara braunii]|uniref:Uncharacterized protein n=1 Tax=Chara braunii TaxID=69332 RepID=A0A388KG79_CHABU|nr:hypothetical protein CBR_g3773 [Chara braunii]|eukprot:GBG69074.1 hypothetical protein CBR_g3773 [Chara braunii]
MKTSLLRMVHNLLLFPAMMAFLVFIQPALLFFRFSRWVSRLLGFICDSAWDRAVVITGASSGIGEHTAYEFARLGAKLLIVARREERLSVVGERCRRLGAKKVVCMGVDVTDDQQCKAMVERAVAELGGVDFLVNNAAVAENVLFKDIKGVEAMTKEVDVTFWGSVYPTHYALPYLMKSEVGRIVVVGSMLSFIPYPRLSMYVAAKHALLGLYDSIAVELRGKIGGVTFVAPGWIESEMTSGKFLEGDEGKVVRDEEARDEVVGPAIVTPVRECAKAIVDGALHREHYVYVPYYYSPLMYYRLFAWEVIESVFHRMFLPREHPLSQKLVRWLGRVTYPSSIVGDGVKKE